ncbi:MAG TPA: methionyl-tRNA formyltransferase [Bacteriovoracaceae bacterium]|nr:methionyl-tRNA formyltransferase [Bacteriovoracaceae bacterium]
MKKFRVAYCGTPDFSVPTLDLLANHPNIDLKYVISMPDRPAGRGMALKSPEVIEYAREKKIPFFQCENINKESEFLKKLKAEDLDFVVVLAFAQFLGSEMLSIAKIGCFNIHTSILPKYRGAAPIQYALLNGDQETGVSIQKMVKKMDAGDLVHFHTVAISPLETGGQLYTRLKFQAALAMNDLIQKVLNNQLAFEAQDESKVSFAPTLKKEDGFLDFAHQNLDKIINRIRALAPWPGTYCFLNGKRLKVLGAEKYHRKIPAGTALNDMGSLVVGCVDFSLRLTDVQLEGKKPCGDRELLNGIKSDLTLTPKEY